MRAQALLKSLIWPPQPQPEREGFPPPPSPFSLPQAHELSPSRDVTPEESVETFPGSHFFGGGVLGVVPACLWRISRGFWRRLSTRLNTALVGGGGFNRESATELPAEGHTLHTPQPGVFCKHLGRVSTLGHTPSYE